MTRAVILSGEVLYRRALAEALSDQEELAVVGAFGLEENVSREIARCDAGLVLLDFEFEGALAGSALLELHESAPDLTVLALGVADDPERVLAVVEAGAHGIVPSGAGVEELLGAVRAAVRGELLCSPRVAGLMAARLAELARIASRVHQPDETPLTPRELEIVQTIARGLSNKEIAEELGVQPQTVKNHVHNVLEKLGLRNRVQIAQYVRGRAFLSGASGTAPQETGRDRSAPGRLSPNT